MIHDLILTTTAVVLGAYSGFVVDQLYCAGDDWNKMLYGAFIGLAIFCMSIFMERYPDETH